MHIGICDGWSGRRGLGNTAWNRFHRRSGSLLLLLLPRNFWRRRFLPKFVTERNKRCLIFQHILITALVSRQLLPQFRLLPLAHNILYLSLQSWVLNAAWKALSPFVAKSSLYESTWVFITARCEVPCTFSTEHSHVKLVWLTSEKFCFLNVLNE